MSRLRRRRRQGSVASAHVRVPGRLRRMRALDAIHSASSGTFELGPAGISRIKCAPSTAGHFDVAALV